MVTIQSAIVGSLIFLAGMIVGACYEINRQKRHHRRDDD